MNLLAEWGTFSSSGFSSSSWSRYQFFLEAIVQFSTIYKNMYLDNDVDRSIKFQNFQHLDVILVHTCYPISYEVS